MENKSRQRFIEERRPSSSFFIPQESSTQAGNPNNDFLYVEAG